MNKATDFPSLWATLVNDTLIDDVIGLYSDSATLMPTFSPHVVYNRDELRSYFEQLAKREGLRVELHDNTVHSAQIAGECYVINGIYSFEFVVDGTRLSFPSRFTFVVDLASEHPVLHHHSSQVPRTLL